MTSLAGHVLALLRDSASADIRPDVTTDRVWRLTYPSLFGSGADQRRMHVDLVKQRILEAIARAGAAVIHHPDSPREEKLPGMWNAGDTPTAWHVPLDLNLADDSVCHWLFGLGNWTVCSPDRKSGPIPDLAKCTAAAALIWVDAQGIEVAVDSFHDDVSWVVVLASER